MENPAKLPKDVSVNLGLKTDPPVNSLDCQTMYKTKLYVFTLERVIPRYTNPAMLYLN